MSTEQACTMPEGKGLLLPVGGQHLLEHLFLLRRMGGWGRTEQEQGRDGDGEGMEVGRSSLGGGQKW